MKSSVSPRNLLTLALALVALATQARAQDALVLKDNTRRDGQITAVANGQVKIKIGPVETSVPLDSVVSVVKPAPKAFDDILATWQTGDANKTLALLQPFVQTYRGLPTPWAERSSALLGEVLLTANKLPEATTAFADFQKAYPNSGSLAAIGLARLAVENNQFDDAKGKLQPILAEAEKVTIAPAGKSATYGQAYYLMGKINEKAGNNSEALRDYLSTVTLFYEDKAVVSKAQERADALVKEKQAIVP
jgi:tetratricopeptide (TPR) repeat protein